MPSDWGPTVAADRLPDPAHAPDTCKDAGSAAESWRIERARRANSSAAPVSAAVSPAPQWAWTFDCGHTTISGNHYPPDACPACGETSLRRKTPAAVSPAEPPDARLTLSERLLNVADGGCACGGRFKWTGVQMRCDRCDVHEGYALHEDVLDLLREAAKVVKRHA